MIGRQVGTDGKGSRLGVKYKSVTASLLCAASLLTFSAATSPTPIKLAIFDFELEDSSAGSLPTAETSSDTRQLASVTNEVRQLFAQSGRYRLVDMAGASAATANAHMLRECNDCAAAIGLRLGADQSFVGVVRRVSRTEYTVRFQIRDTRTGAVVSDGDSGLRMGADYSWSRGAIRLIKDRLLDSQAQQ